MSEIRPIPDFKEAGKGSAGRLRFVSDVCRTGQDKAIRREKKGIGSRWL
jgi:hypothetical protein